MGLCVGVHFLDWDVDLVLAATRIMSPQAGCQHRHHLTRLIFRTRVNKQILEILYNPKDGSSS